MDYIVIVFKQWVIKVCRNKKHFICYNYAKRHATNIVDYMLMRTLHGDTHFNFNGKLVELFKGCRIFNEEVLNIYRMGYNSSIYFFKLS